MAYSMWTFWWLSGNLGEGRRWMEEAPRREPDLPARAELLFVAATLGQAISDFEGTEPLIEESTALFRQLGDKTGVADALGTAGLIALGQGEYDRGLTLTQDAVDLKR